VSPFLREVVWLAIAAIALVAGLYLVVSFMVMRQHATPRSWGKNLSAALLEAVVIALTQPLIPVYYFIGRRMGGPRTGRPVIFVHGYFQNRADFVYLAHAARAARLGPLYGFNYNWSNDVPSCAAHLARFVERVCRETGQPRVALVAHSLGGVVALEYARSPAGAARVERCVTIGSPHQGVTWRATMGRSARDLRASSDYMRESAALRVSVPTLSIFSTHDNIVHPQRTSMLIDRGGADHVVPDVGHVALLFSRDVARAMVGYLSA
jgi:pimeloyl-ACP methyl ester carboxylesterase